MPPLFTTLVLELTLARGSLDRNWRYLNFSFYLMGRSGGEIAAVIMEEAFDCLDAPVVRFFWEVLIYLYPMENLLKKHLFLLYNRFLTPSERLHSLIWSIITLKSQKIY